MKEWLVTYKSRYFALEGHKIKRVKTPSKAWIRTNWHEIIGTDKYTIVKILEVK